MSNGQYTLTELNQLAQKCAQLMRNGKKIGLIGALGAGKTTFVRELTKELGIDADVSSPTFTIMQHYGKGKNMLLHADLYRLDENDKESIEQVAEAIDEEPFVVVEWPEKVPGLQGKLDVVIHFTHGKDEDHRIIKVEDV